MGGLQELRQRECAFGYEQAQSTERKVERFTEYDRAEVIPEEYCLSSRNRYVGPPWEIIFLRKGCVMGFIDITPY